MWNEFMEWVDEDDNPIPIPDSDDETNNSGSSYIGIALIPLAIGIGFVGHVAGTTIRNAIKKRKEKNETYEITKRLRPNIQDQKQETTETLQSDGNYRED